MKKILLALFVFTFFHDTVVAKNYKRISSDTPLVQFPKKRVKRPVRKNKVVNSVKEAKKMGFIEGVNFLKR